MSARNGAITQRVFFALPAPQPLALKLRELADACVTDHAARRVSQSSLHLTLVFCGQLDAAQIESSVHVGAQIAAAPFEVHLTRVAYRARQAIVWLRAESSAPLEALVGQLRTRLVSAQVPFDSKPFLPHVTLARKARAALESGCEVLWPVREFALMRSIQTANGSEYQAIARWPLAR